MLFKDEMLLIKDENGIEKEYAILVTFDIEAKDKSYVLYTDYSKDENQDMRVFAASYDEEWNLSPLIDGDEIEYINQYIEYLDADIKLGINFV